MNYGDGDTPPPLQSLVNISSLGVTVAQRWSVRNSQREFFLVVNGIEALITSDQAVLLGCQVLPEKDLMWSVNETSVHGHYSPLYPEWSVRPTPRGWYAGNIYHATKAGAVKELKKTLEDKVKDDRHHLELRLLSVHQRLAQLNEQEVPV